MPSQPTQWAPPVPLSDQIEDQDKLRKLLENNLSQFELESLRQCQQILRKSAERRLNPEVAEQEENAPSQAASSTASTATTASAGPNGQKSDPIGEATKLKKTGAWWEEYVARSLARAESEGMTRCGGDGPMGPMWFCPACEKEVNEGNLESHMDSNRHKKNKGYAAQRQMVQERHAQGQLPEWMSVVNGTEYCKLCETWATESHLASAKHKKALMYFEQGHLVPEPPPPAILTDNDVANPLPPQEIYQVPKTRAPKDPDMPQEPFPIPEDWGDPNNFEWQPDRLCYFCLLCQKVADENHVYSERHARREQHPDDYLNRGEGPLARGSVQGYIGSEEAGPGLVGAPPPPPNARGSIALVLSQPPPPPPRDGKASNPPPPSGDDRPPPPPPRKPKPEKDSEVVTAVAPDVSAPEAPQDTEQTAAGSSEDHCELKWERFAMDAEQTSFWWWCEAESEGFVENEGAWQEYLDPVSGKTYWWNDDTETWFWTHSGSMLT